MTICHANELVRMITNITKCFESDIDEEDSFVSTG